LLVGLFVVFLVIFSSIITFRLNRTTKFNERIVDIRLPLIKVNKEVLHAIDKNMALSRAYVLIGDDNIAVQRAEQWKKSSEHSIEVLKQINSNEEGFTELDLDSIAIKIKKYGEVQSELDKIGRKYFPQIQLALNDTSTSDTTKAFVEKGIKQEMLVKILKHVESDIIALENDLIASLDELLKEQEDLLAIDLAKNQENIFNTAIITLLISFIAGFTGMFIAYLISNSLLKAVNRPRVLLDELAEGKIPESIEESADELQPIIIAGNKVKSMLQHASVFSKEVGNGNFDYTFNPVSNEDILGNSLLNMRGKLAGLAEEERRRNWISSGIAQFATILRNANKNINEVGDEILRELIKYTNTNQGALFILNDRDETNQYLEMVSCFAYDRKKYQEKKIKVGRKSGEGLVGQTFVEKETTFLKEIPESYIKLNSGLGETNPKCLLIVPLNINDDVVGVLEITSLKILEDYEVEFIEKIGESVASSIVTLKNYNTTQRLLLESQEREDTLRAQEEEMRQNVEELSATQEEMGRKQNELIGAKKNFDSMAAAVPGMIFQLELDNAGAGHFNFVSKGAQELTGITFENFKKIEDLENLIETKSREGMREALLGASQTFNNLEWEGRIKIEELSKWIKISASPSKSEEGNVTFNGTITDITVAKEEQRQFKKQNIQLEQQEQETRKIFEEFMLKEQEYEKTLKEVNQTNTIYEQAVSLGDEVYFEIKINKEEPLQSAKLWHTSNLSNAFSLENDTISQNYGEFIEVVLPNNKEELTEALTAFLSQSNHEDLFEWHTSLEVNNAIRLKGKLVGENNRFTGVISIINEPSSASLTKETSSNEIELDIFFDEKSGKAGIENVSTALKELLKIEVDFLSLERLQEYFESEENDLHFSSFLHNCFTKQQLPDTWTGSLLISNNYKPSAQFKANTIKKGRNILLSGILVLQ